MSSTTILRAYRVALDPTLEQSEALYRHAGASRWAFNHALAAKVAAHQLWRQEVAWATYEHDVDEAAARKMIKIPMPTKPGIQRDLNRVKGDSREEVDGLCPWWHEVSTYAFQSAFLDADRAWQAWLDSLSGKRAGARVGYPRFKKRGRSKDAFRIHHDVKKPTIRPDGYRRLVVPRIGSIRLHGNVRLLARRIARDTATIQSVTISRGGRHWYASVLATETVDLPDSPTRAQVTAGGVGVDLGVNHLAALSTGELIDNPRHLRRAQKRLVRAQRALSRTKWRKESGELLAVRPRGVQAEATSGRRRAQQRLARAHADIAQARSTTLHALTKRLATTHDVIALEDLNVRGMTSSARGTLEKPGRNVRAKAGLNRSVLDASFAEVRRQLAYKSAWYGSTVTVIDRWEPTSKTCSTCGWVKPKLGLGERSFNCTHCGVRLDRDVNAAINILAAARVMLHDASENGESQNADREVVLVHQAVSSTSEGQGPQGHRPPLSRNRQPIPDAHASRNRRRSASARPA